MQNLFSQVNLNKEDFKKDNRHDFQIIGKEISDFIGKPAYHLFTKYNHGKIKDAFLIAQKANIKSLPYIIGIIKKLK